MSDLLLVVRLINALVGAQAWIALNGILHDIDPAYLTNVHVIAVLRTTYPFRTQLSEWQPLLTRSAEALELRGEKSLLVGMI